MVALLGMNIFALELEALQHSARGNCNNSTPLFILLYALSLCFTWEFWKYRLVIGFFCSLITFVRFCFLLWNDGTCFVCSQADDVRALLTDAMPPVTMPPILPKGQAGSSMASSQSSSNKWAPLSFLSNWTSLPVCHGLRLCWTCPAMEGWGLVLFAQRERDWFAGCRKVLGKWVVQRETDLLAAAKCWGNGLFTERVDLLAAAKYWENGLFRERERD